MTVPATITAEATGPTGAALTYGGVRADDIDGVLPVTCDPVSGRTFALGTTTVTCTATDESGNTGTNSFDIASRTPPAQSSRCPQTSTPSRPARQGRP